MTMREKLIEAACIADTGCTNENEMARCADIVDAILTTLADPDEAMTEAGADVTEWRQVDDDEAEFTVGSWTAGNVWRAMLTKAGE